MNSYRKAGTKVGRFTSNGFVEGLGSERNSTPVNDFPCYAFLVGLAGAVVSVIAQFVTWL